MKPLLICLVGLDGTGKTTQARKLLANLRQRGFVCHYVWGKLNPWLLAPFVWIARVLFLRGHDPYVDYPRHAAAKAKLGSHRLLHTFFENLFLLDYALQMVWKIRLPRLFHRHIICDRYVFDSIADLAADFRYLTPRLNRSLDRFFTLLPKPDVIFFFDLPEEAAYKRKRDIPSLEYLQMRRGYFLSMAQRYNMVPLDGSLSPEILEGIIWRRIEEVMGE